MVAALRSTRLDLATTGLLDRGILRFVPFPVFRLAKITYQSYDDYLLHGLDTALVWMQLLAVP